MEKVNQKLSGGTGKFAGITEKDKTKKFKQIFNVSNVSRARVQI